LTGFGQTRKELEGQRKKYQAEIKKLNKLLFNEQKKGKDVLEELRDFQQKIEVRDKLIATIRQESELLSKEISTNEKKINKLNKELKLLKEDYADMIYKSYKSKSQQSRLMFLLSSQNFYQAYKRLAYMRQYAAFRKKQGLAITEQTNVIQVLNDSLLVQMAMKDTLRKSEENQKKSIEADQEKTQNLLSQIKKRESRYKRDLRKKVQEEKRVAARIDRLIKEEIEKANRLAKSKSKDASKSTSKNEFILSPEAKALANEFELNKGKLPWPVKESIIVRRFGKQPHPRFPGITINGTGLHLVTSKGNDAEAIFRGQVLNILVNTEGIKNVLIRHGNYITSYNNLESVYVKKGDKIKTGQPLGKIFTDKLSGKTKLVFVLFKNTTRLNPATWMLPR
jgi:septal ring factor EnvC (AmiA/AmiB activator)